MKNQVNIIFLLLLSIAKINAQQTDFPKLNGPYLGQKPPGMTPEIFAPDIISTKNYREFSGTFTLDGKEYYFFRFDQNGGLMESKFTENGWTYPKPYFFYSSHIDNEPHITYDGSFFSFAVIDHTQVVEKDDNQRRFGL